MSEAATTTVEQLKERLGEIEQAAAEARRAAQLAADRLQSDPSWANQRARDETAAAIEVADLAAARAKRAFQDVQAAAWRDELGELGAAHGDDVSAAAGLWDLAVRRGAAD